MSLETTEEVKEVIDTDAAEYPVPSEVDGIMHKKKKNNTASFSWWKKRFHFSPNLCLKKCVKILHS